VREGSEPGRGAGLGVGDHPTDGRNVRADDVNLALSNLVADVASEEGALQQR
jgi:hypothetical protein